MKVPKRYERILGGAFQNCSNLEKINLSQTKVSLLGEKAFSGCHNLKEIILPESLLEIGQKAFLDCVSLEELYLPPNLTKIDKSAIVDCLALKTITIPKNLDLYCIETPCVYNVPSLEKIIFENGREAIKGYAFLTSLQMLK